MRFVWNPVTKQKLEASCPSPDSRWLSVVFFLSSRNLPFVMETITKSHKWYQYQVAQLCPNWLYTKLLPLTSGILLEEKAQEVSCKNAPPRNIREVVPIKAHQQGCLNKTRKLRRPLSKTRDYGQLRNVGQTWKQTYR